MGEGVEEGVEAVTLRTDRGDVLTHYHAVPGATAGVIWVGGAGGGRRARRAAFTRRPAGAFRGGELPACGFTTACPTTWRTASSIR